MINMSSGFASLRGKGRGGGGGGRSGGRGRGRSGGGRFGRAPRSIPASQARGKNKYGATRTGHTGRPGRAGHYSWSARYNSRGQLVSVSRGYGMAKGNTGQYGQAGTNRGSFRISAKNYNRSMGRNRGGGGGGGVSAMRSVVSGTGGGGSAGGSGPGGGSGGGTNTPGAAAGGPFRIPRERESRARARAEIRGSRALATRRALRIGSSGGSSVNTGRRRSGGRTGVQV